MGSENPDSRTEVIAGITTFMAMAYILIVNPVILSNAGMPLGPLVVSTALIAGLATLLTGLYARLPFAMAPYMGENVFFTFVLVLGMGVTWQVALGTVFWGGLIFLIVTLLGLRQVLAKAVPDYVSSAWAVGIGLFLMFVGFAAAGLSLPNVPGAPVKVGDLTRAQAVVIILGTMVTLGLLIRGFKAGILLGILVTAVMLAAAGVPVSGGEGLAGFPNPGEVFLKLDVMGALKNPVLIPIILVLFLVDMFDTMGTVVGLSQKIGRRIRREELERVFRIDALASTLAPLFGVSTSGTFIESAAGIEAGGKTGKASIVTGLLFLASIPLAGVIGGMNPGFLQLASAPALIAVGILMMTVLGKIDFNDPLHYIPAAATIMFMIFTFNIAMGIAASLIAYPLTALVLGRLKEVHPIAWVLLVLSLLLFVFYPYPTS